MNVFSGEIFSGERWKTDFTQVRMEPYIYRVTVSPGTVNRLASVFIQVFVTDTLRPYYPQPQSGEYFSGEV
jgi:hypothetical protein